MNVLIAGASGFIGQKLVLALQPNHSITVLGRDRTVLQRRFKAPVKSVTWDTLCSLDANGFDVVINLCGHNIAASRWTDTVKKQLIDSRVATTTMLVEWAIKCQAKPRFLCANAVGIYGIQESGAGEKFDEDSPINVETPCDFLSEIGVRWQQALQLAVDMGMSVTTMRFGVVLDKNEGMLKKLGLSFKLGLGSIIGDGEQSLSWVHINDVVGAVLFLLAKPELSGAFNVTSPNPVNQAAFARALAASLHRPLLLKMPGFFIRLIFGEMGESLLLKGQSVVPKRLTESGFVFAFPELTDALQYEYPKIG